MAHDTKELVRAYEASGLSQKDFCAKRGIAVSALQYHLSKMRKRKGRNAESGRSEATTGGFLPVRLRDAGGRARTLLLIRGDIGTEEITDLLRAVSD